MSPSTSRLRHLTGALAAFALLASCDLSSTSAAGGSDDTHTGIMDIQGRVLTKDASPFGNVVVKLRGRNLLDTTDSQGRFQFLSDTAPHSPVSGAAVDTVDYLRDGQAIVSVPVPAWTATLPDIMLVQRDLSGSVLGETWRISKTSCQLRMPDGSVQRIDLEWNATQRTFSGFAYFRYQGGVDSFATLAEVRDDSDRILGRSDSVHFSSRAGDIVFPPFATDNALPKVVLQSSMDSLVAGQRQSVYLFAETHSHLDEFLALEWNLDGVHWLRSPQHPSVKIGPADWPLSRGPIYDTTVTVPDSFAVGKIWQVRARALTKNGSWSEDTLRIRIARIPPYAHVNFASEASWTSDEMDIAPGSHQIVRMNDSGLVGARIASRKLYMVRLKYHDTVASCTDFPQPITDPPTFSATRCAAPAPIAIVALGGAGAGVRVSGSDTTISFPFASGKYQLRYEVIDSDGDTTLALSRPVVVRSSAPRIDSIVASADSIQIDWSASRPTVGSFAELSTTRWVLKTKWIASDRTDSSTVELPDASRSVVLHPPSDMTSAGFDLARVSGEIEGFHSDTLLVSPVPLRLTFSGSIQDPGRLQGRVVEHAPSCRDPSEHPFAGRSP